MPETNNSRDSVFFSLFFKIPTERDCCVWKGTNWPGGGRCGAWCGERCGGCKRNGSLEIRGGKAAYGTGKCWTEHAWSICKRRRKRRNVCNFMQRIDALNIHKRQLDIHREHHHKTKHHPFTLQVLLSQKRLFLPQNNRGKINCANEETKYSNLILNVCRTHLSLKENLGFLRLPFFLSFFLLKQTCNVILEVQTFSPQL